MSFLLIRSSLRFMTRHPVQLGLSVLGVALGVALIVAVDLSNQSAVKSLELSTEVVLGRTTHYILGGSQKLPEELYRVLRVDNGIRPSVPVVGSDVEASDFPQYVFSLLGTDPLAEGPFRTYLQGSKGGPDWDLSILIKKPGTVIMSRQTAQEIGLKLGDTLNLAVHGVKKKVQIAGLFNPEERRSKKSLSRIFIADIATAQELLNMEGRLSRIDLIADEKEDLEQWEKRITELLPPEAELIRTDLQEQNTKKLTQSFRLNLTILSRLALFVSMFLIYNTITFSVIQRRTLFGRLRCLGVTQKEILALILGESAILACAGSVTGIVLGILLGQGLVRLVAQSMSDLYAAAVVASLDIDIFSLLKSAAVGIGATLCAALLPAWEAISTPPRFVLNLSFVESKNRALKIIVGVLGIGLILCGTSVLMVSGKNLLISYLSALLILIGLALLIPLAAFLIIKLLTPIITFFLGIIGRLGSSGINASLSRAGVAIAALMIAISTTVGIGIMISSFRETLLDWVDTRFTADIYAKLPGRIYKKDTPTLEPKAVQKIISHEGVRSVSFSLGLIVDSQYESTNIYVIDSHPLRKKSYRLKQGDPKTVWHLLEANDFVLVSESYSLHNNVTEGSRLNLKTDRGIKEFSVAGVFYSYGSNTVFVLMNNNTYEKYWDKRGVASLGIFVKPGEDIQGLVDSMKKSVMSIQDIEIRSTKTLREDTIKVFNRTFAITAVMRLLALVIAFISILSSLMALQLEKEREIGVLRAIGATPGQVWGLVLTQTGLMGLIAGILSIPVGIIVSKIMLLVFNQRSFGWTIEMTASADVFIQALILSILASLIAGIYPAYKMSKISPALALKQE